jgi:5-methyltetrahydrofolate--homocysteine methyltransferase
VENVLIEVIKNVIVEGDHKEMAELMKKALDLEYKPGLILHEYMTPSIVAVGNRFEAREVFIPEMILAAKAVTVGF